MFYFKKTHREKINLPGCRWSNYDRKCDNACCTPRACSTTVVASLKRIYVTAGEERIRRRKGKRIFQLYLFIYAKINVNRIFEIEFDIFNDSNFDTSIIEHTFGSKFRLKAEIQNSLIEMWRYEGKNCDRLRNRGNENAWKKWEGKGVPFLSFFPLFRTYIAIFIEKRTHEEKHGAWYSKKGKGTRKVEHGQWPDDPLTHISRLVSTKVKRIDRFTIVRFTAHIFEELYFNQIRVVFFKRGS